MKSFKNVWITGIASFFTDISSEMVYPLIPLFITGVLGAGASVVGLIEGVAESTASILKVFSGYISDRLRKRKALAVSGYSFSALGKLILYLSTSWLWVFVARFVDRFGKGVRTAPRDALIADSVPAEQKGRAFGLHRGLDTLGAALGVLAAYFILKHSSLNGSIRTIFLLSLIPAALGVLALLFAEEKAPASTGQKPQLSFRNLDRRLKYFLVIVVLFNIGNSSDQFLILKANHAGIGTLDILLLYFAFNLIYALVSYPAGRLSDRIGRGALLVSGYLLYAVTYFLAGRYMYGHNVLLIFALYGIYMGLTHGVERALVADLARSDVRGTALGLYATLTGMALFPASLIAGLLWDYVSPQAPFYFGAVTALLSAVFIFLILRGGVRHEAVS